jgi:virginiamycin B lyase
VTVSGTVNAYTIPTPNSGPSSITVGPDGNLWITESYAGKLARLTTSGVFTEFKLPLANDEPVSIVAGPDGNLWITEKGRFGGGGGPGKVAKVTTSGAFTEYAIPEKKGVVGFRQPTPGMIVVGPDNNLWFTAADNLDMVTTSGVFTQYVIPGAANRATSLQAITAGPGGNVWFIAGGQPGFRPWVGGLVAVPSKV